MLVVENFQLQNFFQTENLCRPITFYKFLFPRKIFFWVRMGLKQVVFALLIPSCQHVWNKLFTIVTSLMALSDILQLRLFQQLWYSHDITILLYNNIVISWLYVVNLVTTYQFFPWLYSTSNIDSAPPQRPLLFDNPAFHIPGVEPTWHCTRDTRGMSIQLVHWSQCVAGLIYLVLQVTSY